MPVSKFLVTIGILIGLSLTTQAEVIGDATRKVVMGETYTHPAGEYLDELVVLGGDVEVEGEVRRLVVLGGSVHLTPSATVVEDLVTFGGTVNRDPGAHVGHDASERKSPEPSWDWADAMMQFNQFDWENLPMWGWVNWTWRIYVFFMVLFLTFLAQRLLPRFWETAAEELRTRFGGSLLFGFFSTLMIVPIVLFLILTVVGISLIPLYLSLLMLFWLLGYGLVARWLVAAFGARSAALSQNFMASVFVGLLIISLLSFIPMAGGILQWLLCLIGFGAFSRVFYRRIFQGPSAPVSPQVA